MSRARQFLFWIFIILGFLLLTGCGAPSGDPKEAVVKYYDSVKNGNFEAAYEIMAEQSKKNISKEDFVLYQQLNREIMRLKDFKIEKVQDLRNIELEGSSYKFAAEFNITETIEEYYDDKKEKSNTYKVLVVDDNNAWKVYKDLDIKKAISSNYAEIGWMYAVGKGKDRNLNEAAINFKRALEYDKENADAYYGLGVVYHDSGRYDESIKQLNLALTKSNDKAFQSNVYNVIGLSYVGKENYQKAKEAYNKAIELDPNNEYARNNLSMLK
ncbi:MAG: tetratricopeptide repeat protein [Pseudomonadaceae bacterium]|nr:tetratricopeptide repeat protein [Pseudomonadaceae bacterium]